MLKFYFVYGYLNDNPKKGVHKFYKISSNQGKVFIDPLSESEIENVLQAATNEKIRCANCDKNAGDLIKLHYGDENGFDLIIGNYEEFFANKGSNFDFKLEELRWHIENYKSEEKSEREMAKYEKRKEAERQSAKDFLKDYPQDLIGNINSLSQADISLLNILGDELLNDFENLSEDEKRKIIARQIAKDSLKDYPRELIGNSLSQADIDLLTSLESEFLNVGEEQSQEEKKGNSR